ncbi:NADPH:quinone reductase [Roseovarius salinarum]|uniref:NADPH:quinone reductase n=1 Tax=Roseovarius salinarum TaxID=1981892 RepID=UPI000C32270B|nr:NADPH:quinone reductase [Roseovarius salinarum]
MRAVTYSRFGPASDVLKTATVERPAPAPGEVLVRLSHSGVNPSDAKARAGSRPGVTRPPYPVIVPHSDGAGVIETVGHGVDESRVGQHVWIYNGQWRRAMGTAAEYIAIGAEQAVPLPDGIDPRVGATLGIPGLTAAHCVFGGGDVADKTVLISGGAGAVGHNAVQMARWGGARVVATCSARDMERVRAAGAAHVFDYTAPDLAQRIADAVGAVDRAVEVEFGANAAMLGEVLAENGHVAAYGSARDMTPTLPFGPYLFKAITIEIVLIYLLPMARRKAAIDRLHAALTGGGLDPAIHATLPLEDCAKAHDLVMAGGRAGAVLLEIG